MTRHEAIDIAFKIRKDPKAFADYSDYLYSAVGLIKREPDTGSTMAAMELVTAIREAEVNLSDFCKRRVHIIKEAHTKNMCRSLTKMADAYAQADIEHEKEVMRKQELEAEREEQLERQLWELV